MTGPIDVEPDRKALREACELLASNLIDLGSRAVGDPGLVLLVRKLATCVEYSVAGGLLAGSLLVMPMAPLSRGALEFLFQIRWGSLSKENRERLRSSTKQETLRLTRLNLANGHAEIHHRTSGEVRTSDVLKHPLMASAARLPRVDQMAKDGGLKRAYDMLYGFLSLEAHAGGSALIDPTKMDDRAGLVRAHLQALGGTMLAAHLVLSDLILNARQTELGELERVLGLRMS